jgi:enhancing lycopene biosynthesis protein 2
MIMRKIAVVLAGCGYLDGSEITEAVAALIALSETGAQVRVFAPDLDAPAKNHLSGQVDGSRNTLVESARIARGHVQTLSELKARDFDGVFFPGGFGAALNLCNFAEKGAKCQVHPEAERVIREFRQADKPIGAACIAPALIAKVLGSDNISVTIGKDAATAQQIRLTGAEHIVCPVDDFITDREHKIVTTPAYMYEASPFEVFVGIRKAVREFVEMS